MDETNEKEPPSQDFMSLIKWDLPMVDCEQICDDVEVPDDPINNGLLWSDSVNLCLSQLFIGCSRVEVLVSDLVCSNKSEGKTL